MYTEQDDGGHEVIMVSLGLFCLNRAALMGVLDGSVTG